MRESALLSLLGRRSSTSGTHLDEDGHGDIARDRVVPDVPHRDRVLRLGGAVHGASARERESRGQLLKGRQREGTRDARHAKVCSSIDDCRAEHLRPDDVEDLEGGCEGEVSGGAGGGNLGERRRRTCFQVRGAGRPSGLRQVMRLERPSTHSCSTG